MSVHLSTPTAARPSSGALAAFFGVALFGGSNAVAIRLGNLELEPFWGASLRFLTAGILLLAAMAVLNIALPRGRAFRGVALFGLVDFGLGYGFLYWSLQEAPAGMLQMVVAMVPLATFVLAVSQRVERFRFLGLLGSLIAAAGIAWMFAGGGGQVSLTTIGAMVAGTVCFAQAGIIVKRFPEVHPVAENALGMLIGGGLLLVLSFLIGEERVVPTSFSTWASLTYLIVFGSIAMFLLYIYLLHRWTASAAAYAILVMPVVTVVAAAAILNEPITTSLIAGGALVIVGVYIGVFARPRNG